ncbi:glutamyl-tRNA reductase [Microbacterium sp. W4I4]|nr:glutamyl-tRNA reductase [Microbacterium sp. W4I4]
MPGDGRHGVRLASDAAHSDPAYSVQVLLCVTASHKTASFDLLERLSRHPETVAPTLVEAGAEGAVVLSTCNRFEAYVETDDLDTGAVLEVVAQATGIPSADLDGSYRVVEDRRVAEHLFAVASGLESVVSGEGEIAGQVRRALTGARKDGTTSPALERLFQRASQAQRKVKNVTALQRAGRSLVRLSLELADSRIADWAAERVLLVGTGSYAAVTLATLRERGAVDISVFSPSGRAELFAKKHGIRAVSASEYAATAQRSSLLITCTSVSEPVLGPEQLQRPERTASAGCPAGSAGGSQLVIDLGMPRNVDPAVAQLEGVALLDLETIRLHAPIEELQATDAARAVVREAAEDFHAAGSRAAVTPAVVALRTHIFELLEAEIDRARRRGDEDGMVEQAMRHLAGVLLHTPTTRAHELAADGRGDEFVTALETLYGLIPESGAGEAAVSDIAASDVA